jgi:hypothetical protein
MRDGRRAELKDQSEVDKALEASTEWLVTAANKTWDTTRDVGKAVGSKTEDVAGKTAETGKAVGKGVKRGAEGVADKTKDAAGLVKKGARKAVDKVKN